MFLFFRSNLHCVKIVQIRSFFWSVFSRIRILRISPYSVRMRENADQKKLCFWILFTQCYELGHNSITSCHYIILFTIPIDFDIILCIYIYRISSNKDHPNLFNFEALRCGTYYRAALKKGRCLF